jgi:AcrR family transcriptional regulator
VDVKPRKSPRQARAKATVDAIVEATTQILQAEGFDHFTTARVAERAGVSVGSLYQYFPNKAALASAVVERCCETFAAAFEGALAGRRHETLADCVRALIDVTLISHHLAPAVHRIVLDLAPRLGAVEKTQDVSKHATRVIESMLRGHATEIAAEIDITAAASIIEATLEALAHRAVVAQTEQMEVMRLSEEAARLMIKYLRPSG